MIYFSLSSLKIDVCCIQGVTCCRLCCAIKKIYKKIYWYMYFFRGRSLETIFFLSTEFFLLTLHSLHILFITCFVLSSFTNSTNHYEYGMQIQKVNLSDVFLKYYQDCKQYDHTFNSHSTRHSFRNKTKNQSIKNLLSFAVS